MGKESNLPLAFSQKVSEFESLKYANNYLPHYYHIPLYDPMPHFTRNFKYKPNKTKKIQIPELCSLLYEEILI